MLRRDFVDPESGVCRSIYLENRHIVIEDPSAKKPWEYRRCAGEKQGPSEEFHEEVRKLQKKKWRETELSLSRKAFVAAKNGKPQKFWIIELNGTDLSLHYGAYPTYGYFLSTGTRKTLEFSSEEEARYEYVQRILKKQKEGYTEYEPRANAYSGLVESPPPKPKKAKRRKTASEKSAAKAATTPAAARSEAAAPTAPADQSAPQVVEDVVEQIDLEPTDAFRAAYRKTPPLAVGETPPFDMQECIRRLRRVPVVDYRAKWSELDLTPAMTAQEAHFWLLALTTSGNYRRTADRAKKITEQQCTGRVGVEDAAEMISSSGFGLPHTATVPLVCLLGLDGFLQLLETQIGDANRPAYSSSEYYKGVLCEGLAACQLPYLARTQLERVREWVNERWPPQSLPTTFYEAYPPEVYLAAALGMHKQVRQIVDRWEEGRYASASNDWQDHYQRPQDVVFGLGGADEIAQHWQRAGLRARTAEHVRAFLACTGTTALDRLVESIVSESNRETCVELLEAFGRVRAPAAAEPMLRCMLESKAAPVARSWLNTWVGSAIHGLVETACGRGRLADAAVQYLRDMKKHGHESLIQTAAERLDENQLAKLSREVIEYREKVYEPFDANTTPQWLATELETATAIRGKKLPDWVDPAVLPPVVIDERRLNDEQLASVFRVLTATILPKRHPLLRAIREHGDRDALDRFAWRLFELWLEAGAVAKEKWALCAVGHLGNDASVLRLTPMIRVWPGESQHQRAVLGLECLKAIGSDTALTQLNGIAQKLKYQGLKKRAREFMDVIAEEKGLTREELEDRIVPDLDLDERGLRTFDFGPRSFSFVLKPDLKPAVRDESGKVRANLPAVGSKDDSEKAQAALAEWKLLKKQLREAIKIQIPRLEQAMVTGRRWTVAQFESFLVRHPLMTHFARMLLWGGFDQSGQLKGTFRVTEEQDYADEQDEACDISGYASIGIVHPLCLNADVVASWGEVFSDYEIVAPFPQLGREIHTLEVGEKKQKEITRYTSVKIAATTLVGTLDRLGWTRGIPEDAGIFHEHSKPFYGADVTAILQYEDGIPIGYMEGWDDQTLCDCFFVQGIYNAEMYPRHSDRIALGQVDEIVISEVLGDLEVLAAKGKSA